MTDNAMREIWHQSPWDPLLWNQDQVSFLRRILKTESGSPDTRVSFPIYQMHPRCGNWNGETLQWPLAGHQEDSRVHSPATHMCLSTDDYCHFVLKRVSSNDFSQLIMFPLRENYVQCTSKECGECDVFSDLASQKRSPYSNIDPTSQELSFILCLLSS